MNTEEDRSFFKPAVPLTSVDAGDKTLGQDRRGERPFPRILLEKVSATVIAAGVVLTVSTNLGVFARTARAPISMSEVTTAGAEFREFRVRADASASAPIRRALKQWGGYCEAMFKDLAKSHPAELAALIRGGSLPPPKLTFAAEILGAVANASLVTSSLLPLLDHRSAIVREGAIYGLASFPQADVRKKLAGIAESDSSSAVREAARDVLKAS